MTIRFFAATAAFMLLGACATTPQPPPANLAVTPSAAAPPAAAPSAPPASAGADDHLKVLAKRARELNYTVENRNGQPFYCQTAAQLGTRFQTKGCMNQADFEDVVRRSSEIKTIMHQPGSCSGVNCVHN
jgi:hypothetical protein